MLCKIFRKPHSTAGKFAPKNHLFYQSLFICFPCIIRKTKRCAIFKRTAHFFRTKRTSEGYPPFSKIFRLAYASIQQLKRRWNTIPTPFVFRFVASLPLCYFGYRLVGFDALRFLDFSAESQARPDTRARVRSIVIRIRVRHTAIRVRVADATINHTAK